MDTSRQPLRDPVPRQRCPEHEGLLRGYGPGNGHVLRGVDGARRQVDLAKDSVQGIGCQGRGGNIPLLVKEGVGLSNGLEVQGYYLRLYTETRWDKLVSNGKISNRWHVFHP